MDFGDLKDDKSIQDKIQNFHNSVGKIEKMLERMNNTEIREKLTLKEKVDYDLFMVYSLNTLYWLYLRTRGLDPNKNDVKSQLNRVKEYMIKAKQAHDRNTIRPTINQKVAERFVKHGISYSDKDKKEEPPMKKLKTDN